MSGGLAATFGQGFVSTAGGLSFALVGAEITTSRGVVVPGQNHGLEITSSQGTLTPAFSNDAVLTGIALTASRGSVVPSNLLPALTGIVLTGTTGFVTALGNNVTVHMDGFDLSVLGGSVTGGTNFLTGIALTGSLGSPVWGVSVPLLGGVVASDLGTIGPELLSDDASIVSLNGAPTAWSVDVPLLGSLLTGTQGFVSVTGDTALPLLGSEFTATGGLLGFGNEFPLVGIEIAGAQNPLGAPGGASLTGIESAVVAGDVFLNDDRTFALVGEPMTITPGLAVTSYLAFATGQEIVLSQEHIGPVTLDLTGLEITSASGVPIASAPQVIPGGGGHPHKPPKPPKPRAQRIKEAQEKKDNEMAIVAKVAAAAPKIKPAPKPKKEQDDDDEIAQILKIIQDLL